MKRGSRRISLVVVLVAAGLLCGCSSPERELRKAKEVGTVAALDAFLARHPDGPLAQEANDAKEQLFFNEAKAADTLSAYEAFLVRYPNGKLLGTAKEAIATIDLKVAETDGSFGAYEAFLRKHPEGPAAEKAGLVLDRLVPPGAWIGGARVTSTEPTRCTAFITVTLVYRAGTYNPEPPPETAPVAMDCGTETGAIGLERQKVAAQDSRHTAINLKTWSEAGWGVCRGTCTVRFSVLGQERSVTAEFK